jgi:two-component system sensor histidine kinase MtrB
MSQPDHAAEAVDGRRDETVDAGVDRPPGRVRSLGRSLRRHLPLRLRAGVAFGLLSALLSVTLSAGSYVLVRSSLMGEREEVAERQAFTNARLLRSRLDPLPADMTELLAGLQVGGSGDSLLRIRGQWFSSSVQTTSAEVPEELARAVAEGDASVQVIDRFGSPALAVGVPIAAVEARYFEISSLAEVESTLARLARALAIAAIGATALGGVLGAALSSVLLRPLRRFAVVAKRITGDGTPTAGAASTEPGPTVEEPARLDAEGDADLQPLADSFNEMLDELDERIARERRFASDVSHEIRGPVAALASALSIIERRRDRLPADVVPVVDALDEQVTAFNRLVLDLLEISRFDARTARLETEPVDLGELCERLLHQRGYAEVELEVDGVGPVHVDRRRVEQVLSNLLENAARYGGGATDLRVQDGGEAAAVRLRVEDRGPGVPPAEREVIFGRFQRGKAAETADAPGGSGLGLALSRQHVELHGGRLWVEDRPGGGASFVVELPGEQR